MMQRRLSQPPITSPAWILMRSFRGMLISSSTVQGLFTCPLMLKSLVQLLPHVGRPQLQVHLQGGVQHVQLGHHAGQVADHRPNVLLELVVV